jgi:hypothetical protein
VVEAYVAVGVVVPKWRYWTSARPLTAVAATTPDILMIATPGVLRGQAATEA